MFNPLNNTSISKKIVGFIALLLLTMLGISIYSYIKNKNLNEELIDLNEWILPLTNSIAAINSHTLEEQLYLDRLFMLYEKDPTDSAKINKSLTAFKDKKDNLETEITAGEKLLEQAVKKLNTKEDLVFVSRLEPALKNIESQHLEYYNNALKVVDNLNKNQIEAARVLQDQLILEEDRLDKVIGEMRQQMAQFSQKQAQIVNEHDAGVLWLSVENVGISILAFVLGIIVTAVLTERIVKPVRQIITGADDIAHGKLDVKVPVNSKDEIGMLAESFNSMVQELRSKERIKATFGQYVDPRVVEKLLQQEESGFNKGEKRVMTVFFSDVEGFSTITEFLTPLGLVNVINKYLTLASEPIVRYKGVIDKYIGDAVMSFWGPPFTDESDHAKLACMASLEQFVKLEELQQIMPDLLGFRKGLPKINIRIGLCTGELIVGNIGSNISKSYTVLGDTVNIASRLESANKHYGTRILMSEETYKLVKEDFETREIDNIIVVGKSEPVRIFELLGTKGKIEQPVAELRGYFEQGLAAYRSRDWNQAQNCFDNCLEINPSDGPAKVFLERVKVLRETPPPEGWNSVWQMTKK